MIQKFFVSRADTSKKGLKKDKKLDKIPFHIIPRESAINPRKSNYAGVKLRQLASKPTYFCCEKVLDKA